MRVAIVGRPNVGKSTLFNRLVGRRTAIVNDRPGVTRDYRDGHAQFFDLEFTALDTAGYEPGAEMMRMTEAAICTADICLFLIDGREGVLASDEEFADRLRRGSQPVLLVANKIDDARSEAGALEACRLGFGEPICISAEHGLGLDALRDALCDLHSGNLQQDRASSEQIRIVVVGRPNSGKSSLVNRILGYDRLLIGAEPGITRDAVTTRLDWQGVDVSICDTAGMRRKPKIIDVVERLSVADATAALRRTEVAIILIDATAPFESQDLRIANLAEREGRAVVVALNKWDLIVDPKQRLRALQHRFRSALPSLSNAPLVAVSAHDGSGLAALHASVRSAFTAWNRRIGTAEINRWLNRAIDEHPPPAPRGQRIRLRYATQVKARPPTFVIMCSHPRKLPDSYSRYLVNRLRQEFDLAGSPVRIHMRSQSDKNPFAPARSS